MLTGEEAAARLKEHGQEIDEDTDDDTEKDKGEKQSVKKQGTLKFKEQGTDNDTVGVAPAAAAIEGERPKKQLGPMAPPKEMLEEMQNNNETYFRMAMRKAKEQRTEFTQGKIEAELEKTYSELAKTSHNKQAQIENTDTQSFDRYLADYWTMSKTTIQGPV